MNKNELFNILLSNKPSMEIQRREEEIFELIPELKDCKGFDQNSSWHIYDVYEHTLHVVDNVNDNINLRLAALFHDIGKPYTYSEDEKGNGHFYNHWQKSKEIFLNFAKNNDLDKKLTNDVANLIYYHDVDFNKESNLLLDVIEKIGYDNISDLFNLKKADLLAQSQKYHYLLDDYNKQENKIIKRV